MSAVTIATMPARLTKREREVAVLAAHGHTPREVGAQLGISYRTAESYKSHAMAKLDVTTRAELVAWSIEHGLFG